MFSFTKKIEQLATVYDEPKGDLKQEVRRLQRLLQQCQLSESDSMSNEGDRELDVVSGTVLDLYCDELSDGASLNFYQT